MNSAYEIIQFCPCVYWSKVCQAFDSTFIIIKRALTEFIKNQFRKIAPGKISVMKTKADLDRLSKSAGATLEEDEGYRDMRTFQIVAPDGKRWVDGGCIHIKVEWAKGTTKHALEHNRAEWLIISEAVACGLEEIPSEEAYVYARE